MRYVYGSLALPVLIIGNPTQLQLSISRALCILQTGERSGIFLSEPSLLIMQPY